MFAGGALHEQPLSAEDFRNLCEDCRTAGREGYDAFKLVTNEAHSMRLDLCAILFLDDSQKKWVEEAMSLPGAEVFVGNPSMKQLTQALRDAIPDLAKQGVPGT